LRRWVLLLLAIGLVPACKSTQPVALPELPHSNRPVVFVADGAGDFRACSGVLRNTAAADGVSLEVITFVWSHGYLRNVADQTDYQHSRNRGAMLAEMVRQNHERFPDAPVTLLGHSAGSAVVLAAAESLPPASLDRIVLLAPSLSVNYDLRPALATTRNGIDVFISEKDWIWLGVLVRLLGTMDNPRAARAAGRFGFAVTPTDAADGDLYAKLRLHRWTPGQEVLGHDGGHFGWYQPGVLRNLVMPLLTGDEDKTNHENTK
jgi:pimeloyl-ACP methyl ester carboxylesterase